MRLRKRRDRGFSLIVVFMLMLVMTGTAIGVLVATQADLNLAGAGREQQMALYAAEYAVARAKALIASQTVPMFNATSGWNGLLTAPFPEIQNMLCDPATSGGVLGKAPGLQPFSTGVNPWTTLVTLSDRAGNTITGADVQWRFCIHNNAEDPGYLYPLPGGTGPAVGNTDDSRDPQHLIVIEAWGTAPNGAAVKLSVSVGAPTLNSTGGTGSYAQEGAAGVHTGEGGASEAGISVGSGRVTF